MFDDLCLMSDGRIVYFGPADEAVKYFYGLGFQCPTFSNPSDYIFMNILNNDKHTSPNSDKESVEQRIARIISTWEGSERATDMKREIVQSISNGSGKDMPTNTTLKSSAGMAEQCDFLFNRASKNAFRNPLIVKARVGQLLILSIIIGLTYYRVDWRKGYSGAQDRNGSLFFLIVNNVMASCFGVLNVFGGEKAVFSREYGAGRFV